LVSSAIQINLRQDSTSFVLSKVKLERWQVVSIFKQSETMIRQAEMFGPEQSQGK